MLNFIPSSTTPKAEPPSASGRVRGERFGYCWRKHVREEGVPAGIPVAGVASEAECGGPEGHQAGTVCNCEMVRVTVMTD